VNSFLHENICNDTFLGLFVIWTSQYVTAASIFLATLTASIIYQLFGRYWDYENEGEEGDEGGDAEGGDAGEAHEGEYQDDNYDSEKHVDYGNYNKYDEEEDYDDKAYGYNQHANHQDSGQYMVNVSVH
jgi:hypothetical protein